MAHVHDLENIQEFLLGFRRANQDHLGRAFQHRRATNDWSACPGGGKCVKVVNILGYFVSHMNGNDVVGYLINLPGEFVVGAPAVGNASSFLKKIQLIR